MDSKIKVLEEVSTHLNQEWFVFGSMGLKLKGMDIDPDDVDIWTTDRNAEKLREVLSDKLVETIEVGDGPTSDVDVYRINGEELEVIYGNKYIDFTETEEVNGFPVLVDQAFAEMYQVIGDEVKARMLMPDI
ncbi:MAG: nucleotidyltransferase domain-containing protein [Candidatus Nanohaloarchaea archaeon]